MNDLIIARPILIVLHILTHVMNGGMGIANIGMFIYPYCFHMNCAVE